MRPNRILVPLPLECERSSIEDSGSDDENGDKDSVVGVRGRNVRLI
jgi:hypothetical protein